MIAKGLNQANKHFIWLCSESQAEGTCCSVSQGDTLGKSSWAAVYLICVLSQEVTACIYHLLFRQQMTNKFVLLFMVKLVIYGDRSHQKPILLHSTRLWCCSSICSLSLQQVIRPSINKNQLPCPVCLGDKLLWVQSQRLHSKSTTVDNNPGHFLDFHMSRFQVRIFSLATKLSGTSA